jgi:hypothetical protein
MAKSVQDRRVCTRLTLGAIVIADLDTLLTALYVELTDAELVCLAIAQVLLRYDDERHWLRAAPARVGHLLPRPLRQSEYNDPVKNAAPLMEAALRWLADHTPGPAADAGGPARQPPSARHRSRGGQGLRRGRLQGISSPARSWA